jgi:hypothetical protein
MAAMKVTSMSIRKKASTSTSTSRSTATGEHQTSNEHGHEHGQERAHEDDPGMSSRMVTTRARAKAGAEIDHERATLRKSSDHCCDWESDPGSDHKHKHDQDRDYEKT